MSDSALNNLRRLAVRIGSSLPNDSDGGLDRSWLANAYQEVLWDRDVSAVQILLTLDDTEIRRRFASTQFAGGYECGNKFGMGAEIGIAMDRIHARDPGAAKKPTSHEYVDRGSGQIASDA